VTADQPLEHTLDALAAADGPVPVLSAEHTQVVGWLSHQHVLRALTPASAAAPQPIEATRNA
jgi:hypothetical protein